MLNDCTTPFPLKAPVKKLDQTQNTHTHSTKKNSSSSTISKAIFNEPLPLFSIYQNGIRTALSDWGERSWENGGMWQKEKKKKVFIKDSEVEVGEGREGGKKKWERKRDLNDPEMLLTLLSSPLPPNQGDKVMPVRAFVIPANPSSRYFIRFGIWLSALIRCSKWTRR